MEEFRLSRSCYYVCLGLWACGIILYALLKWQGIELTQLSPYPCIMLTVLGVYCPGCGGTRAVECLFRGNLFQSMIYHPMVPYTAVLTLCYIISHTMNIVTKGRIKAMQFRTVYLFVMLGILLLQWIGKNVLKLGFGIEVC